LRQEARPPCECFTGDTIFAFFVSSSVSYPTPAALKILSAIENQLDEASTELVADTADTPEQTVLHSDRNAQLRSCIAQMSREHREVIDLVYYHEKSVDEVAEIIHLPKNTVKTRMFYARKRLARLLSTHQDFDHLVAQAA
jgi:RNA polymerase sigma factor (sigma-70 family)